MMHRERLPATSLVSGQEQPCRGRGVMGPRRITCTKIKEQNITDTQGTTEQGSTEAM